MVGLPRRRSAERDDIPITIAHHAAPTQEQRCGGLRNAQSLNELRHPEGGVTTYKAGSDAARAGA